MMINRRLIGTVRESKKYIAQNVALQWCGLLSNIVMIFSIAAYLEKLYLQTADGSSLLKTAAVILGAVTLSGCIAIILLSADFFIPMRQLGSFFHIAMNGMAASDKIFRLLDLPQKEGDGEKKAYVTGDIRCSNLCFSYDGEREVLKDIGMELEEGKLTAIVGESGSQKSTIASVLTGKNRRISGSVTTGGPDLWRQRF